jgi:hypothetical protein
MKNRKILTTILVAGTLLFTGCAKQPQLVGGSENIQKDTPVTLGIDKQDFEKAASDMLASLLRSGALVKNPNNPKERYVVLISDIINDTTQRIDTRMLTKKIRIGMLNSGKAVITSSQGTERDDTTISTTRAIRGNAEFNQNTAVKEGQLIGAELGLQGRIMQRNTKTTNNDQLVEYYFQMTLTDAKSGLAFWEDEIVIGKLGSNETVSW